MPGPQPRRTLGLIGGMGPYATVDLFQRILDLSPAQTDQDHLHILIDNDPSIEDRTLAIQGKGASPLPKLMEAAARLIGAGAEFLAMPCNTAHYWHGELETAAGVPVLHMIRLVADAATSEFPSVKRFGLLATTGTVASDQYQAAFAEHELEVIVPSASDQERLVMAAVYGRDGVKAGNRSGAPRERIDEAIAHLMERGAAAAILGCTELPLLYADSPAAVPALDPTHVLAQACVSMALGFSPDGVIA